MTSGNPYPDENRDRLKNTNNSWTYPEKLGPGPIKAHIPDLPAESPVDKAEAEGSSLDAVAKKAAAAAKEASAAAKTAPESLAQKGEINSTPWKL